MRKRLIISLFICLPLPVISWFFKGIDKEYDWIVFIDFYQRPHWYIQYTSYHLENIIKTGLIWFFCLHYLGKREAKFAFAFVLLAVWRLIEYWLFRHHIPFIPLIGVITFYYFYIYGKR